MADIKRIIITATIIFVYMTICSLLIWGGYELFSHQKKKSRECPTSDWKKFRIERDAFNLLTREYTVFDEDTSESLIRVNSNFPSRFEMIPTNANYVKMNFNREFLKEFANVMQPCYKVIIKDVDTTDEKATCEALPNRIDGDLSINKEYTLFLNGVKYTAVQDYLNTVFTVNISRNGSELVGQARLEPTSAYNRKWHLCVKPDTTVEERQLFMAAVVSYDVLYIDKTDSTGKERGNGAMTNWGIFLMLFGSLLVIIPILMFIYLKIKGDM